MKRINQCSIIDTRHKHILLHKQQKDHDKSKE